MLCEVELNEQEMIHTIMFAISVPDTTPSRAAFVRPSAIGSRTHGSSFSGSEQCAAYGERSLNLPPTFANTNLTASVQTSAPSSTPQAAAHGSGAMRVISPARNAVAPTVPMRLYIWFANSGNAAPKHARMIAHPESAAAAIGRYAVTKYVKTEM